MGFQKKNMRGRHSNIDFAPVSQIVPLKSIKILINQKKTKSSKAEVVNEDLLYILDSNGSGALVAEVPQPNWFWRLLGYSTKKITLKVVVSEFTGNFLLSVTFLND
jgi:hypothetical protein